VVSVTSNERFTAIIAHISAIALPFLGPLVLTLVTRKGHKLVHEHAVSALALSACWCIAAVGIISLDVGRFSVDEQETSLAAALALLALTVAVIVVVVFNIGRARRDEVPLGRLGAPTTIHPNRSRRV